MHSRPLGNTEIAVSAIAFGAGPVPALLTGSDAARQRAVVERAIELGVNWFDTAAGYGDGASEAQLGAALADIGASTRVYVATKVRLLPEQSASYREAVLRPVSASLARLRVPRVSLLQLHNAITATPGAKPSSVSAAEVLAPGGILDALAAAKQEGLCEHIGLTAIGDVAALKQVIASGQIAAIQTPFSLVQPAAGYNVDGEGIDDYRGLFAACQEAKTGILAIRVFAGGAIVGRPPSEHTKRTPYFPLDVYERDRTRAEKMASLLPPEISIEAAAIRFAAHHPAVNGAIVGLATVEEVDAAVEHAAKGPLPKELVERLLKSIV